MARVSIEDCLDYIENRFALVAIAAHRTRQLIGGDDALIRSKNREGVTALREIADGLIAADDTDMPLEAVTSTPKPKMAAGNGSAETASPSHS